MSEEKYSRALRRKNRIISKLNRRIQSLTERLPSQRSRWNAFMKDAAANTMALGD